jgi:hypothetical protein
MISSKLHSDFLLKSPLEGSPTLVGRGVSPFEGGAGGWLARFITLIKLQVKVLQLRSCNPPRANAERISSHPLRMGIFTEAQ